MHARDRSEIGAPAAQDVGAAKHHRRDRRQEVGVAHRLEGAVGPARQQDAAEGGACAGDDEADDEHLAGIDTRQEDRALVVADRVDLAAERCAGQHEHRHDPEDRSRSEADWRRLE